MASEAKATTNHNEIKQWTESRGGKPTTVKSTIKNGEAGILRIDFPGYQGEDTLEEITWDVFFAKFDANNLAFLYQEQTSSGEESRFFKLVRRDTAELKAVSKFQTGKDAERAIPKTDPVADPHVASATTDGEKGLQAEHPYTDRRHKVEHKARGKSAHKAVHADDAKVHATSDNKHDEKERKVEHKADEKARKKDNDKKHSSRK